MTITRAKVPARQLDGFIAGAPDAAAASPSVVSLKAKRGIRRSQVSIVLADELIARVDSEASRRYMSRSALVTLALHRLLNGPESGS